MFKELAIHINTWLFIWIFMTHKLCLRSFYAAVIHSVSWDESFQMLLSHTCSSLGIWDHSPASLQTSGAAARSYPPWYMKSVLKVMHHTPSDSSVLLLASTRWWTFYLRLIQYNFIFSVFSAPSSEILLFVSLSCFYLDLEFILSLKFLSLYGDDWQQLFCGRKTLICH